MSLTKNGKFWHYDFILARKRFQGSTHTTSKTLAKEFEKNRRRQLEKTLAGIPAEGQLDRLRSVSEVVSTYLDGYGLNHRPKSVLFARNCLANITRLIGSTLIPELNEAAVRTYMKARLAEGVSGRTVNMELGELSRAIGHPWSILWPKVRKIEERKEVGRALSPEEERRLLAAASEAASPNRSQTIGTFIRIALMTGMRSGEITGLTWGQVDFGRRVLTVGRAKTSAGTGRTIPMNDELFAVLTQHADWYTQRFGVVESGHYLFPFGKPTPSDPTRPITDITGAWDALRKRAGVQCRLHDLRHTAATKMAERGVPESTMLAIMGHMSRAMLERYSHIRMEAKRAAVEALQLGERTAFSEAVPAKVPAVDKTTRVQ